TDILRRYIEDELEIPAMESTTREIMAKIKHKKISKETKSNIKELLKESDFVKFAKFEPESGRHPYFRKSTEDIIIESHSLISEKTESVTTDRQDMLSKQVTSNQKPETSNDE
ncbi:MAG: hypothetical protein KAG37_05955, partial [Flavobacteriales bacterium]|nr:hypothetical protein [Flavobacteriales bacterium]